MYKLLQYYGRFQRARGGIGALPAWARWVLVLFALPGITLIALSILALCLSILALLLLTMPVFRLLSFVTGAGRRQREAASEAGDLWDAEVVEETMVQPAEPVPGESGRRRIDVKIIEQSDE